tara:strand:- start:926 stop:2056 length:1131 start_codon:yes stop_codon:yes gene_type:complete
MFKFGNNNYKTPIEKKTFETRQRNKAIKEQETYLDRFYGIDSSANEYSELSEFDIDDINNVTENIVYNSNYKEDDSDTSSVNSTDSNDMNNSTETDELQLNDIQEQINNLQNIQKQVKSKIKNKLNKNNFNSDKYCHTVQSKIDKDGKVSVVITESKLCNKDNITSQAGGGFLDSKSRCNHWSNKGDRCKCRRIIDYTLLDNFNKNKRNPVLNLELGSKPELYGHYCLRHAKSKRDLLDYGFKLLRLPSDRQISTDLFAKALDQFNKYNIGFLPINHSIIRDILTELNFQDAQAFVLELNNSVNKKGATSSKKKQSPSRKKKSPSRKKKSPSRKKKSPSRKKQSPSKKKQSPSRKKKSPSRKKKTIRKKTKSPKNK